MKKIIIIFIVSMSLISCKMMNDCPYVESYTNTETEEGTNTEETETEEGTDVETTEEDDDTEAEEESTETETTEEGTNTEEGTETEDGFELENDSCEIDENITPNELMKFNYFICFNNEEKLINENEIEEWTDPYSNNFDHLEIRTSMINDEYVFDLWITKSENKLKVLKYNGGNPTLKNVYLENGNEVHIVF